MTVPASSPVARHSLRLLSCPHALEFGSRLLSRDHDGVLTFREFLDVARDLVREQPDESAFYLATLVALDMGSPDEDETRPPKQSHN